uniref:Uncharacterized protein n=1 Tax=Amphimedon queenslandica TaxID=400682 RepID=A0A1X7UU26_AMPQE
DGITVTTDGVTCTFYGTVLLFSADTLAAHQLGGFKVEFTLRTPALYDYQCSLLSGPIATEDSVTYGLNCQSHLNDIDNFHVANMQLPQDIMHVLFEEVILFEMNRTESRNRPLKGFNAKHFSESSKNFLFQHHKRGIVIFTSLLEINYRKMISSGSVFLFFWKLQRYA